MSFSWSQSDQVVVHWQKSIGMQGEDVLNNMIEDEDGNFYFVGSTQTAGSQTTDILVSKHSPEGLEIWTKIIGASGDDKGIDIELLGNTLFVLSSSNSTHGAFSSSSGREDIVLLRLDLEGNLKGMSRFGGNYSDIPTDITQTSNGELLISAHSESTEGLLDQNKGQFDAWVFRLDRFGTLIWKKNFGGSDEDFSRRIAELSNGEILLFGHSASYDGDMMLNYGDLDLSLFKLSPSGEIIWEQNYGGLQAEVAVDLLIGNQEQIILASNTLSLSYDISKNAGFSDAWVVEVDATNGGILWECTHGSEYGDYAAALSMDESNQLYIMGTTNAMIFRGEESSGNRDAWIAQVNTPNSIDHLALYGGEGFESINDFSVLNDGTFLMIGGSNSTNYLFSGNNGNSDGWVMKAELNDLNGSSVEAVTAHPNPTNGEVYLNHLTDTDKVVIYSTSGQIIDAFDATSFSQTLDLTHVTSGLYLVKIERNSGSELIRLIRE
ncbi:MAG: T9SS type A sorting domain-containing protein [Crocinitomicaceae bacterium]